MPIQFIALDLDGTLLNDKKEITPATLSTLLHIQEKGIRLILASGRATESMMPIAEKLHIKQHNGYILSYNGAVLTEAASGNILYNKIFPSNYLPSILSRVPLSDFSVLIPKNGIDYTNNADNPEAQYHAQINHFPLQRNELTSIKDFNKCLIVGKSEKLIKLETELKPQLPVEIDIYRSSPIFLECVPKGIDKAATLDFLMKHCSATSENIMAFGDSYNDLSMLQYAGLGIAMGNAPSDIKALIKNTTLTNNEDGVAAFIASHLSDALQ